jgi:hypothetical protein
LQSLNTDKSVSTPSTEQSNDIDKQNSTDDSISTTSSNDISFSNANEKVSKNHIEYNNRVELLMAVCGELDKLNKLEKSLLEKTNGDLNLERVENLKKTKYSLFQLKNLCYHFLLYDLKRIKEDHACFHPNLNFFNKFKAFYRQIKEFYLYLEASLNTLASVYNWNESLILKKKDPTTLEMATNSNNEYDDLMNKIVYLNETLIALSTFVEEANMFDFNCEISVIYFSFILYIFIYFDFF